MVGVNGAIGLYFAPVFLGMIAIEVREGTRRGLKLYSAGETWASIGIAVGQRIIGLLPIGLAAGVARWVWAHRLYEIDLTQWWAIPVLFVAVEFNYYWFHRMSHEVRWLWATHAVHHSIEEMNVLAAYRLGWTGMISMGFLFYMPIIALGFHPLAVGAALAFNLFYQSWLHTNLIGRLGWLEGVLNTPSSHRVHHARNADYLDRNHGGVTVIFDRVFGTYVAERDEEPVDYGLVKPLGSHNPMIIALHEWFAMARDLRRFGMRHWPALMFGPPGWAPNGQGQTSADLRAAYRARRNLTPDAAAPFLPEPTQGQTL